MADDIYKSLLDKSSSPGSTWGELAGMYFSGGRKKDNRARNILLASLFFNAKEAAMQSKVARQLQDLEDEKDFEKARLAAEFNKRSKLQTLKESIDESGGAFNYYRNEAEQAFNDKYAGQEVFKLGGVDAENYKRNWMKEWSNQFADSKLANYNANVDPNILTLEEFSKPTMQYFKAKRRDITRPENVSLIHKMFGKLPGFGSDEEYSKLVDKYDKQRKTQAARVKGYLTSNFKDIQVNLQEGDKLNNFEIDGAAFNTLAANFGITDPTVLRNARNEWRESGKTYGVAKNTLNAYDVAYNSKLDEAALAEAERRYIKIAGQKPNEKDEGYAEEKALAWQAGFDKAKRSALGVEIYSKDLEAAALELFNVAVASDYKNSDEREAFLNDYYSKNIREEIGEVDLGVLKQAIIETRSYALLDSINDTDTKNQINKVSLSNIQLNELQISKSEIDQQLYEKLADPRIDFDINKFNSFYGTSKPDAAIVNRLRQLQKEEYILQDTKLSLLATDAIDNAFGNDNPLNLK